MKGHEFLFRSVWHVPAPLVDIWNRVGRVTEYPTWWPGIKRVDLLKGRELPITVGTQAKYEVTSPLYQLEYQTEVVEFETGKLIVATAVGDLVGTGTWMFQEKKGETQATFDWQVHVSPVFLRAASYLPPVRHVMRFFHNQLMDAGERGLRALYDKTAVDGRQMEHVYTE